MPEVRVPATAANLGPGFDVLGVALGSYLTIRFSEAERSTIAGKGRLHPIPDNLTYRAFMAAYEKAGAEAPQVRIETVGVYPSARGMGASASAIVAGLVGARALGSLDLSDDDLARLATSIEGHPDNVLPALFGGLVLSLAGTWINLEPSPDISPIILVAKDRFRTGAARKVVPGQLSRADAIANASATAALVLILTGGTGVDNLMAATEDRMHEPYRLPLMPATQKVHRDLRSAGIATTMSGAGPSLIAMVPSIELPRAAQLVKGTVPEGWQVLTPGWDRGGAQVD
ncbi:MAG TPA: homoserine kinase [Actinomycetota bacterium]|nr:homoserine kinase [Actinomycetota bacterium]